MRLRDRWDHLAASLAELGIHTRAAWDWSTDGCTGVPDLDIRDCCVEHDFHYRNGTLSRARADRRLRRCIRAHGYRLLPWIYWIGVRLFGWRHYRKGRRG